MELRGEGEGRGGISVSSTVSGMQTARVLGKDERRVDHFELKGLVDRELR